MHQTIIISRKLGAQSK